MANKPSHKLLLVNNYKDKNWEQKTKFSEIASGRVNDNGNVFYEIPKGMLITGTLLSSPVKDKVENKQETIDESTENDLPF